MKYEFHHSTTNYNALDEDEKYPILDWGYFYNKTVYEWQRSEFKLRERKTGFTGKTHSYLMIKIILFRHCFSFSWEFNFKQITSEQAYKGYHKIKD
jgi:hypothetical protein